MASNRITKSLIDWLNFSSRVPENQRHLYQEFKSRCDNYLNKVLSYPENPPAINWDYYKQKIPNRNLVHNFEKKYNALQIPYPVFPENLSQEITAQETDAKRQIELFKIESDKRIDVSKTELIRLENIVPFDQMTMEDFRDAYPNDALDPINKPTFWPHNPEEQIGYKEVVEERENGKNK